MARTIRFSQVLWLLTTTWLVACGRLGFDSGDDRLGRVPDAAIDDAAGDAVAPDAPPVGPKAQITVPSAGTLTTMCGGTGSTGSFKIVNTGDQPLTLAEPVLDRDGGFALREPFTATTLAPGASISVEFQAPDAVIGSDFGGSVRTGTLKFPSNLPATAGSAVTGTDVVVELAALVQGANLVVTSPSSNLNLTYTGTGGNCPAGAGNLEVKVKNTGNLPITLQAPVAENISLTTGYSGGAIAPGQIIAMTMHVSTSSACAESGTLTYTVSSASAGLCTDASAMTMNASLNITGSSTGSCFCS